MRAGIEEGRVAVGALAPEMEAFIFLFLLVSKCVQRKTKSKVRKAELEEEKSFYVDCTMTPILNFCLIELPVLNLSLLPSSELELIFILSQLFHLRRELISVNKSSFIPLAFIMEAISSFLKCLLQCVYEETQP